MCSAKYEGLVQSNWNLFENPLLKRPPPLPTPLKTVFLRPCYSPIVTSLCQARVDCSLWGVRGTEGRLRDGAAALSAERLNPWPDLAISGRHISSDRPLNSHRTQVLKHGTTRMRQRLRWHQPEVARTHA